MDKEELKSRFDIEFQKLGGRSRNLLQDLGLDKFYNFYQDVIEGSICIDFKSLRSCGVKTETELRQFIEKFPNEKENTENKFQEEIISNWLLRQKFPQLIARQNPRIKKLLKNLCIDSLQDFSNHFLIYPEGSPKYLSHSLPFNHFNDLLLIRENILEYHKKTKRLSLSGHLFFLLHYLLIENNTLREVEWDLLKHYYGFLIGFKSASLQEIANKYNLSKERIRQISQKLLKPIDSAISNLESYAKPDISTYLHGETSIITREIEKSINEKEKTGFSRMFMTYVLSKLTDTMGYYYLKTSTKRNHISGIFIHGSIKFSFDTFYQDIEKITRLPRKSFYRLPVNYIFQKYGFIAGNINDTKTDYEEKVLNAILILLSSIPGQIEYYLQNGYLMVRRNSHK